MNRAIGKMIEKYVSEVLRLPLESPVPINQIALGDRVTKVVQSEGWRDIEALIIQSINRNMLLMMEEYTKEPYFQDPYYLYKGYIAGYSWLLRMVGYILWAKRIKVKQAKITQATINYLRGFNWALISLKDTIYEWIKIANRRRKEIERKESKES